MRIGVNTRILIEGKLEGVGLFTHEVLRRIVEKNPHDEFVFFFDRRPSEKFIYNDRVTGVILPPQARHPVLWYWWFERRLPRMIERYGIDLFISTDGYTTLNSDVPSLVTIHDLAFRHFGHHIPLLVRRYFNHYTPRFVRKATHLLTVSEFSKRDIVRSYDVDPGKITVVGNGCDEAVHPLDHVEKQKVRNHHTGKAPYFIYIGSIHPRKNVARLLQAFDAFKRDYESDIKLVLAGRWAWKTASIRKVLTRMGHRDDVIPIGHLERDDLGSILAASIGLIYPSLFEGFGIPVLEALYAEVPVITSQGSSMAEVAGPAAIYVDPENTGDISRAMTLLAKDHILAGSLVEKGRAERKRYSWEITAGRVWQCVEDMRRVIDGQKKDPRRGL
jgi:glycosyltransferase involved in cell wall biosynthesis